MRIAKIWDFEYPWDVRVEKVTGALIEAGHEVHLICRNRKGQPLRESLAGLEIHRMSNWPRAGSWLDDVSSFPAFMNPRWIGHVTAVTRETRAELILCRDLPLAPLALRVGRRLGLPVVVDIAENYPAMLKHRFHWRGFKPHNLVVRNPWLARLVERSVVRQADGVLAVVEESRDRLVAIGAPAGRVEVVCNTPTMARIEELGRIYDARRAGAPADTPLRLVYLGLLGRSRGIETVLQAQALLKARGRQVHFDVIGTYDKESNFRADAAALGVSELVTFHGYVPYDAALRIVAAADVGIVPHHATEHWSTTIPNKLFDYMAAGLPVLVSDAPPTLRVVEETGAGLAFRDRDPAHLAEAIERLESLAVRRGMAEAGRRAVLSRYNWTQDAGRLTGSLERVLRERRPPVPKVGV